MSILKSLKSKISNIFGAPIGNSLQELEMPSNEEDRASLFFNLDKDGPDYDIQVKTALEKSSVFKFQGFITKCTETMHARASPDRTFFFINKVGFHISLSIQGFVDKNMGPHQLFFAIHGCRPTEFRGPLEKSIFSS